MISQNLSSPSPEVLSSFELQIPVRVRVCTPDDLSKLEWFGMFTHDRQIIQSTFLSQANGAGVMLVAEACGFPIAQLWMDLSRQSEGIGLIWAFRVIDCYQNLGIGARLITAAEEELARRGFATAELTVDKHNASAVRFYLRHGYSEAGERSFSQTYTTAEGLEMTLTSEQWVLQKTL